MRGTVLMVVGAPWRKVCRLHSPPRTTCGAAFGSVLMVVGAPWSARATDFWWGSGYLCFRYLSFFYFWQGGSRQVEQRADWDRHVEPSFNAILGPVPLKALSPIT